MIQRRTSEAIRAALAVSVLPSTSSIAIALDATPVRQSSQGSPRSPAPAFGMFPEPFLTFNGSELVRERGAVPASVATDPTRAARYKIGRSGVSCDARRNVVER